jgi:hypothetical protein
MRYLVIFLFFINTAMAGSIIIEPDDYADGTVLSNVSPYVRFKNLGGGEVTATELTSMAADGYDTLGLGRRVIGGEWFYSGLGDAGLEIEFNKPVSFFSILVAEIFPDAGPGSDPVIACIYDLAGELLSEINISESNKRVDLGVIKNGDPAGNQMWAYWSFEFRSKHIHKIVLGGNSEPTTFDRLQFDYSELPEPKSYTLLAICLLLIYISRRSLQKSLT